MTSLRGALLAAIFILVPIGAIADSVRVIPNPAAAIAGQSISPSSLDVSGASNFGTAGTRSTITTGGILQLPSGGGVTVAGVSVLGSTPSISHVSGAVIVGTLASGTTFTTFTPDAAITLLRLSATVVVAGVGGSGDAVKCNNAAGTGISLTLGAAAAAGTTGTSSGSAAIAYQGIVSCHIDSAAATRPILTMLLEYITP